MSPADTTEPIGPDWTLAKSLHTQGFPLADICRQCRVTLGALKQRIARNRWLTDKLKLRHANATIIATITHAPKPPVIDSLKPLLRVKARNAVNALPDNPPVSPRGQREHAELLALHTATVAKLEGWNDAPESTIQYHLISDGLNDLPDPTTLPPAIDVESVPPVPPEQPEP